MWSKKFTKEYQGVTSESVWKAWTDVANWPKWDSELEYCDMQSSFGKGATFILKPKGGPKVRLWLLEVMPKTKFTDYCKFWGAVMYDEHLLEETSNGVRITNIISVKGPFAFLWTKLVAKGIASGIPKQTDNFIEYVKSHYE